MRDVITDADRAAAHEWLRKRWNLMKWEGCFSRCGKDCVMLAQAIADAREAGERAGAKRENWACEAIVHSSADIGEAAERIKARRTP